MSSRRSRLIALLGVLLTPGLMACGTVGTPCPSLPETPTTPCGTFTFTGTPEADVRGVDITVAFSFHPPLCSAACNSSANAYVQVIRIIDIDSGAYMQPHSEQQDRIVSAQTSLDLDGWAVDRIANRTFGHYGRNDDGSFVAERVVPGSNIAAATLTDQPVVWPDRASFEAVSVCDRCRGNGAEPGTPIETCDRCDGTGQIREVSRSIFGQVVRAMPCDKCGGDGRIPETPCERCGGAGRVSEMRAWEVDIPAGIEDGQRVRIAGAGHAGARGRAHR